MVVSARTFSIHDLDAPFPFKENVPNPLVVSTTLNLTAGLHNVEVGVYAETYYLTGGNFSPTAVPLHASAYPRNFTIILPKPVIVAPESVIYNESRVPLSFILGNLTASWLATV